MSITTGHGDDGWSAPLFGGRVPKHDPRFEAAGDLDELNAILGLARIHVANPELAGLIARLQHDLIAVLGMVSAGEANSGRYRDQGFREIGEPEVRRVTEECAALEARFPGGFDGWATPGAAGSPGAAWLDFARAAARRAERSLSRLAETDSAPPAPVRAWINRISDLLWLAARVAENPDARA